MTDTRFQELKINQKIIKLLNGFGISDLFPPQVKAFETNVLDGKNLVLAIPTSSGKTLVAEICMLKAILEGRGKAIYLVPLRALAHEKYQEFKKYESLGITTAMSVGDYDSSGTQLSEADIAILTTERADSLVRNKAEWISEIGIIIMDEIHLVNDSSRGPTVEMVLAKLLRILPNVQVIALSATISNADDIAGWLNAELVRSTWRPIPLNEGVSLDGKIIFRNKTPREVKRTRKEELTNLICDILDEDGQVLIFVSSRRSTASVAKRIAKSIRPYISKEALESLGRTAARINSGQSIPEASKTLAHVMSMGAAFHHAGLTNRERAIVEANFKENLLKVIVATPTLAAGVNLPARRVIIRDYRRFESGRGSYPIPILEYKQMAGRAGRPKYDKYGEAILVAKTEQEYEFLTDHYIDSDPEEIISKLASPPAVQFHLLSSIAAKMTNNREEIDELIAGTFFSYQFDQWEIEHHVSSALTFLEEGDLIESRNEEHYTATPLGARASRLYIAPQTAILIRDVLSEHKSLSEIGILHLVCHTPDQPISYVTQSEFEDYQYYIETKEDELLISPPDSWEDPEGFTSFLGQVKTARLLQGWILEQSERNLTEEFNVGMGDIHRYVHSSEWLLYSASEIARVINESKHIPILRDLRSRMKYGVRSELLELVTLKGVGRVRGRMLYNHDLRNMTDLYNVPLNQLAGIPAIGTAIAVAIKRQLGIEVETPSKGTTDSADPTASPLQTLLQDFENSED
ncbi:MAG: DEAD/DEAH box helicase [Candidatus Thorarchaeota archaeon]|jgi:helicase